MLSRVRKWWSAELRRVKRRKLTKFLFFSVILTLLPIFVARFSARDLYLAGFVIILLGGADMLFDREHQGKSALVFVALVGLCMIIGVYGAMLYGDTIAVDRLVQTGYSFESARESTKYYDMPRVPPFPFLVIGVLIGGSASYFSEVSLSKLATSSTGGEK